MENKSPTIDDLLNALIAPFDKNNHSSSSIWDMIAKRKTYDEMGFMSESDLVDWIIENPYDNL